MKKLNDKRAEKQLNNLKEAFFQLSHGNLSYRIKSDFLNNNDEMSDIKNGFNEMANNLELSLKSIEKNQVNLENIIAIKTKSLNDANIKLYETLEKLKKTQENRIQFEKQKSLSTIVSGFAHEINNPLTGILGQLELLSLKDDVSGYIREKHKSMRNQALRIKSVVKELELLNPVSEKQKLKINLLNFFEKFIKVFNKKYMPIRIEFVDKSPSKDLLIIGNHFSLWMVFESICKNSIEAIKDRNIVNGEIKITLNESKDKKYAIIEVSDNGGGFENIEKIFDPFYTTKGRTEKKGIGLSIVYNMIFEHNGSIKASNNDKGSTIRIVLPLSL